MSDTPAEAGTGGTPPAAAPITITAQGPAFPVAVRLLATAMVGGTLYWGLRSRGELLAAQWDTMSAAVVGTALVLALWALYWMWRSRTGVDAEGITQTWIWTKRVRWADITQAKLIGVPGLQWLIAPRLVVRPRGGGIIVFHSADRLVLAAFASFVTTGSPQLS